MLISFFMTINNIYASWEVIGEPYHIAAEIKIIVGANVWGSWYEARAAKWPAVTTIARLRTGAVWVGQVRQLLIIPMSAANPPVSSISRL